MLFSTLSSLEFSKKAVRIFKNFLACFNMPTTYDQQFGYANLYLSVRQIDRHTSWQTDGWMGKYNTVYMYNVIDDLTVFVFLGQNKILFFSSGI